MPLTGEGRRAGGAAGRRRAGGERPGRRARGGAHAGLRGEARGRGGESAALAARPARARWPGVGRGAREGRRRVLTRSGHGGGRRGLVGIPGASAALTYPRTGVPGRAGTAAAPGRSPQAAGPAGALLSHPVPSSPGPRTPSPAPIRRRRGGQGNALSGTGANSETKDIK